MVNLAPISEVLSQTLTDNLRKPLQPSGLFASALFVLLNTMMVYPLLLTKGFPIATYLRDLETGWQVVLIAAFVLTLSYLLLGISATVLKLFTGELWAHTRLGYWFWQFQRQRRDSLMPTEECANSELRVLQAELASNPAALQDDEAKRFRYDKLVTDYIHCQQTQWSYRNRFPLTEGQLAPTGLGNVINATADQIWQRYRIDMTALWPFLDLFLAEKDMPMRERIQSERATLDFLLNAAFVLLIFALEYALIGFAHPNAVVQIITVALALGLALGIFYPAAVGKAFSWGQAIQMAFDRYQPELTAALGLQPSQTRAEARYNWFEFSRWIKTGTQKREVVEAATRFPFDDETQIQEEWPEDRIFARGTKPQPRSPVQVRTASEKFVFNIFDHIVPVAARTHPLRWPEGGAAQTIFLYAEEIHYTILLEQHSESSESGGAAPSSDIHFLVNDPRIAWIAHAPQYSRSGWYDIPIEAELLADSAGIPNRTLLWRVADIPTNGSRALHYSLPKPFLIAHLSNPDLKMQETGITGRAVRQIFSLQINNPTSQPVFQTWLYVIDERPASAKGAHGRTLSTGQIDGGRSRITLIPTPDDPKSSTITKPVEPVELYEDWLDRPPKKDMKGYHLYRLLVPEIEAGGSLTAIIHLES